MNIVTLLIVFGVFATAIYQLSCASLAATIAGQKNYNRALFFVCALLMFGPLNIAVALLAPPAEPLDV